MQTLDCRSEEGVTVGIIDAIITLCHLMDKRDTSPVTVQEALKDLRADESFRDLLTTETIVSELKNLSFAELRAIKDAIDVILFRTVGFDRP